nr:MAG TPA: hypothetical protein [Caudoviricetes sp.]
MHTPRHRDPAFCREYKFSYLRTNKPFVIPRP